MKRSPQFPRRLKVASARNSVCAVPLHRLDWSRWWTDSIGGDLYLHVACDDGTVQRVHCRHRFDIERARAKLYTHSPRLAYMSGQLYWLIDRPGLP